MNNFNRWIRSKTGIATIASVIVLALVVAVVGQFAGWWGGPGTAGLPPLTEESCMPTCDETDGRFLVLAGSDMASFAGFKNTIWISVPQGNTSFTLSIFDGDSGQDINGGKVWYQGSWDTTVSDVTYSLYADALRDGSTSTVVGTWSSTQMPNNAWYDINIDNVQAAVDENLDYRYRLEATLDEPQLYGASNFKLKSPNAYLSVGDSFSADTSFGINAMLATWSDVLTIYPEYPSLGNSTYGGTWEFYFEIPEQDDESGVRYIEIWNGDADRGTSTITQVDTDDANTSGKPEWASVAALDERAGGKGNPADDNSVPAYRRGPTIQFVLIGPDGNEIARDDDPGGTEEWEKFLVSTDPNSGADQVVDNLPSGVYKLRIEGLDMHNFVWIHTDLELFSNPPPDPCLPGDPECGECVPENSNLGGGYAIIALNPDSCQGQQNGLLFHGTSYTQLLGKAISNGCLRSVGTHMVESAGVEYVGEYDESNTQVKIIPDPYQVSEPVSVDVAAPNCKDPAAHQMNGKNFKGDVFLEPGLYCIKGDVTINAGDTVKGDDVTLYFTNGKLTINGGATVQLSAPYAPGVDVSPALSNILFYVPGSNGNGKAVTINGTSDSYFSGVVYAPGSEVEFLGTSHTEGAQTTQIIGWDVRVGGTADLILAYTGTDDPVCEP